MPWSWSPETVTGQPFDVSVPRAPQLPKRHPFPVFATLAPVVAATAIWVVTQSPFAMIFALLGPVVAVASLADSRRRSRVEFRREHGRFERELVAAIHLIDEAHAAERAQLDHRFPAAANLLSPGRGNPERWRSDLEHELTVRLGTGRIHSSVKLLGERPDLDESTPARSVSDLFDRANALTGAPITVDARLGIGVCGAHRQAAALGSAVVAQLAHALSPAAFSIERPSTPTDGLDWVKELPHCTPSWRDSGPTRPKRAGANCRLIEFRARAGRDVVVVAIADDEDALPPDCRIVVQAAGTFARIVRHPGTAVTGDVTSRFAPEFISEPEAVAFSVQVRAAAQSLLPSPEHRVPGAVALSELNQTRGIGRRALPACVGADADGPVVIDLVRDGPHAVVGGTTGSGKSELLLSWILALATAHDPDDVSFLLVDFKGGAAFSGVAGIPHTMGVLTDLDESAAHRAIVSLRAELRRRERILAQASARSIDELDDSVDLARLVIVVDEFATLTAQLPELHDLFADLAARGRSLGIHLILCTQRPAASVRDGVLANCSLRVSLRVTSDADSVAVLGTTEAARLPRLTLGRGMIVRADAGPEPVQFALSTEQDVLNVASRFRGRDYSPHRPWIDPLPPVLLPAEVPAATAPARSFGVLDIPEEQRRSVATFDPGRDGNLLVLGGHRSGKSGVLAALAAGSGNTVMVPRSIEGAWDAVAEALQGLQDVTEPTLILLDDVDELLGRFPPDHEAPFAERLGRLAREGPRAGVTLVLAACAVRGRLQSLAALCESTLLLRMPTKQDHVLAGGDGADFVPNLPPGAGRWQGHRVQVTRVDALPPIEPRRAAELGWPATSPLIVVSSRPAAILERLATLGPVTMLGAQARAAGVSVEEDPAIILGDPNAWQGAWGMLTALRPTTTLAFHGCSASDIRALTHGRELSPPVDSADTLIVFEPDGRMFRARLPG